MMGRQISESSIGWLSAIERTAKSVPGPSLRPPRPFERDRTGIKAKPLLWLPLVALLAAACSNVSFVTEITFVNHTDYPAHAEVSDASRQQWLSLTIAERDVESRVQEVIDQGDVWVFRFDYAGQHEEELEFSRSELIRAKWRIEVPQSFGKALQRLDVRPPP